MALTDEQIEQLRDDGQIFIANFEHDKKPAGRIATLLPDVLNELERLQRLQPILKRIADAAIKYSETEATTNKAYQKYQKLMDAVEDYKKLLKSGAMDDTEST